MIRVSFLLLLLIPASVFAGDPFLPTTGPIQTWNLEVSALVWEAHVWWGAAQGPFETCDEENRWLSQPFTVARPDGKRCAYYSLYWSQRRRLWEIFNALGSYVDCSQLDVMARLVIDSAHPLSCQQLQHDFGPFNAH